MTTLLLLAATLGTVIYAAHIWQHPPVQTQRGLLYLVGSVLAVASCIGAVVLGRTAPEGMSRIWNAIVAGMLVTFVTAPAVLGVLAAEVRVRAVRRRDRRDDHGADPASDPPRSDR